MKLSELVNFRNQLDALSTKPTRLAADLDLDKILFLVQNQNVQISDFGQQLQAKQVLVQQAFDSFENDLVRLKQQVKLLIETTEKPWFAASYKLYDQEMIYESTEYILNRRANILPETEQFFISRIRQYNTWQHPAMIIRPGLEPYINELLGTDPLYLVDQSHDLLTPCMNQFTDQYKNRLRTYTINERTDPEILYKLPNGQFGLVFAYNYFNFRPFEVIKKYFIEIFEKLRPGGTFVLTFNDCDRDKAVMLVESNFCCYTPGYLVKELAQSLGYQIHFSWTDQGPTTWLELRKPGQFETLRGGQALAKIMPK